MAELDKHVVVVGGGLAGMACAVGLAGKGGGGVRVTLLEARKGLGGRASSFEDRGGEDGDEGDGGTGGELLDNCQHVLLGCCTNLIDLFGRMGVMGKIGFHRRVHFLDGKGRGFDLWGMKGVPAPLHLGVSMAWFGALTVRERVAVLRAMLAMMRMGKSGREKLEGMSFGEWLDVHRQPASVVRKFYDPVLISALNEETRRASAKYAIQVFQDALMANGRGYVVGLPECALGELYAGLGRVGGVEVRVGARVEEVLWEGEKQEVRSKKQEGEGGEKWGARSGQQDGVRAVGVKLRGGEILRGDAVVLATNYHAVMRWVAGLPAEVLARDGRFGGLEKLESVPILGVHMWFDRGVMKEASAALIEGDGVDGGGGPLQWLFRKDKEGRQLHGVISAARGWEKVSKEEALGRFEGQVRGLFPGAREAKLLRGVIVIEKRATFSVLPGVDGLRPAQVGGEGGVGGLYLAGDYTKTGWPATMEGAVRGGYMAAEGVLRGLGREERVVVGDLGVQWPGRLMGLAR